MKAHKEAEELPWPPTAEKIACRSDEQVPIDLKRFLNLVLSGNEKETSETTLRLVVSMDKMFAGLYQMVNGSLENTFSSQKQ